MKKIELFEKAIKEQAKNLEEYGINGTMFWAYRGSMKVDNDYINFEEVIWDKDIEEIAKCLKENEIYEFTISSNFSGLINTLVEFEKHGYRIVGLTTVKASYKNPLTDDWNKLNAIRLLRY